MHHGRDADAGKNLNLGVVLCQHVLAKVGVAVLKTEPNGFGGVGPQTVHKLILPCVGALGYGLVLLIDENSLDAGRAKLDTENGFTCNDGFFCAHITSVPCSTCSTPRSSGGCA